jgi:hypothetical protein
MRKVFIPGLLGPSALRAMCHALAAFALASLQACAPLRPLPGVRVTPGHTASLYINTPHALVLALDDTRFDPPVLVDDVHGSEVPIPSGRHTIELQESWGPGWQTSWGGPAPQTTTSVIEFEAEPGHRYQVFWDSDVASAPRRLRRAISPQIVDVRGGRLISRVLKGGPDELR